MKIIKSNTYNVVNTDPFDMPLPLEFELMSGNALLASYKIHGDRQVDYSFSTTTNERILTSTNRPLDLNDIYFLFSSRVFQDKTPFTEGELIRFGVEEYNPYEIIRKTHGIMPIDRYWIKFHGEDLTYKKASEIFAEYFTPPPPVTLSAEDANTIGTVSTDALEIAVSSEKADDTEESTPETIFSLDSILEQKSNEYHAINDAGSILNEHKLDVESLAANIDDTPISESAFACATVIKDTEGDTPASESSNNNMLPEAISALLAGAADTDAEASAPEPPKPSGGNMSPETIAALLEGTGNE